jgi:hypothetical protein
MKNLQFAVVIVCLIMLLAACSSAVGNADAGPNPGRRLLRWPEC